MSKVDIFAIAIVFSRKLFNQVLDQTAPTADSVNLSDHGKGRSWHEIDCVLPRETSAEFVTSEPADWHCRIIAAKCQQPFIEDTM
jgi:hypothetical protein